MANRTRPEGTPNRQRGPVQAGVGSADDQRLALAEAECRLARLKADLASTRERQAAAPPPAPRRNDRSLEIERELQTWQLRVAELRGAVPDPDLVVAADGSTPPQR